LGFFALTAAGYISRASSAAVAKAVVRSGCAGAALTATVPSVSTCASNRVFLFGVDQLDRGFGPAIEQSDQAFGLFQSVADRSGADLNLLRNGGRGQEQDEDGYSQRESHANLLSR
jgi:hypothetical protein